MGPDGVRRRPAPGGRDRGPRQPAGRGDRTLAPRRRRRAVVPARARPGPPRPQASEYLRGGRDGEGRRRGAQQVRLREQSQRSHPQRGDGLLHGPGGLPRPLRAGRGRVRPRGDAVRDVHRQGAVRRGDARRNPDEAPLRPAGPLPAADEPAAGLRPGAAQRPGTADPQRRGIGEAVPSRRPRPPDRRRTGRPHRRRPNRRRPPPRRGRNRRSAARRRRPPKRTTRKTGSPRR